MTREEFGPTMEADAVKLHLQRLGAAGISPAAVSALLDLPNASTHFLREVRRGAVERVNYAVGSAVLAVKVPADDRDTSWTEDAECRRPYVASVARSFGLERGTDLFFASTQGTQHPGQRAALAICGTCRVRDECLSYALAAPGHLPEVGIWGGTTDDERKKLRRKNR